MAVRASGGNGNVIGTWNWLGSLILLSIPGVGLIVCIVWAIASGNPNRRNFSRALLLLSVIAIILSTIFTFAMGAVIWPAVKGAVAPYVEQYKEAVDELDFPMK
jgi:hypothetical protein